MEVRTGPYSADMTNERLNSKMEGPRQAGELQIPRRAGGLGPSLAPTSDMKDARSPSWSTIAGFSFFTATCMGGLQPGDDLGVYSQSSTTANAPSPERLCAFHVCHVSF